MAVRLPLLSSRTGMLVTLIGYLSLTGLLFLPFCHARAATIVLDPGHGGSDRGAGSDGQFSEKQFTLSLAQKIAGRLAAGHRIELTRTSDISMAPEDRAAVANHLRADLMISLHAAVFPYCSHRAAAVYYHNDERLTLPSDTSAVSEGSQPAWARLQVRHQHQSQYIAAMLKQSLIDSQTVDSVTVDGVPLVALMGTDLPAVMLELGCIHPKAAPDPKLIEQQLNEYAASIARAIEAALSGLER
jgi:N-acetylmuramoyl-L-alanine amidase